MIDRAPGHVPTFRTPGLPPGYGDCIACGQRITKEELVAGVCPGKPEDRRAE